MKGVCPKGTKILVFREVRLAKGATTRPSSWCWPLSVANLPRVGVRSVRDNFPSVSSGF